MNLRPIALSLVASVTTMTHAYARTLSLQGEQILGRLFFFIILGVGVLLVAACFQASPTFSKDEYAESDGDAAERHEREAARLRALKRQTDAQTELTASLIDKARIDAEYGDIKHITEHDRKVRGLKRNF